MKLSKYILSTMIVHASLAANADAHSVNDCKGIEDDKQRLACYDQLFPRNESGEALHVEGSPKAPERPSEVSAMVGTEQPPAPSDTAIETRLIGDFTGWSGRTVFALDNGEVWQQTKNYISDYTPRSPIPQPKVTITKGMFGSYNLRIEGVKRTVQVKRIE